MVKNEQATKSKYDVCKILLITLMVKNVCIEWMMECYETHLSVGNARNNKGLA